MWRVVGAVVLPFVFDGLVALALATGDRAAPPASRQVAAASEHTVSQAALPGVRMERLAANSLRSTAMRPPGKVQVQPMFR
jgi:hypothetical protein